MMYLFLFFFSSPLMGNKEKEAFGMWNCTILWSCYSSMTYKKRPKLKMNSFTPLELLGQCVSMRLYDSLNHDLEVKILNLLTWPLHRSCSKIIEIVFEISGCHHIILQKTVNKLIRLIEHCIYKHTLTPLLIYVNPPNNRTTTQSFI